MKPDWPQIAVGDWIHSYSPGIWQVFRLLVNEPRMRLDLSERKRTNPRPVVFSKRLVNESWRPSFAAETCCASVVHHLSEEEHRMLDEFLTRNPALLAKFAEYEPKDLDLALDVRLCIPASVDRSTVQREVDKVFDCIEEKGLTNDDLLLRINASKLGTWVTRGLTNAILRFICKNHELRTNDYVFREAKVITV